MRDDLKGAYYETKEQIVNTLASKNRLSVNSICNNVNSYSRVSSAIVGDMIASGEVNRNNDGTVSLKKGGSNVRK